MQINAKLFFHQIFYLFFFFFFFFYSLFAFASSDIPLYKLKSPDLRPFLTKYKNFETPAESTLRKVYVPACYEQMLGRIRAGCENNKKYGYAWTNHLTLVAGKWEVLR
ncbi:hypothetical protein C0J52_02112 [Blattella germanica]|nr:hypothetical protein C0J52_02112 [Blattella germanica]